MVVTITWQHVLTAAAVLGALATIVGYFARGVRWVDRQKAQDKELAELKDELKEELTLLTYGILASLKGLKEQGCNGPVTEAINKIEKHLNKKAHE